MIKLVENSIIYDDSNNLFLAKINANNIAENKNCDTWIQNENAAVLQKCGGVITVYSTENADFGELDIFLQTIGFSTVFADKPFAKNTKLKQCQNGVVMKLCKQIKSEIQFKAVPFPEYSRLFNLLKSSGLDMQSFEAFCLHLAPRVCKGNARVFANQDYTAAAFTAWESKTAVVISAVAVDKSYRKKGLGKAVVCSLCNQLSNENKTVFLYRNKCQNREFYYNCGFKDCGEFFVFTNK